ncbi:MAG TPA: alpha-2-macroglobulin family protein [Pyrinomonadaceae bacterium]|jgi:hypothetical protein
MTRRWLPLLLCAVVCLCALQHSAARDRLHVNEAATTLHLNAGQTSVSLALENPTNRHLPARIRLEVLDPDNRVRASAERQETLREGSSHATVALPFSVSEMNDRSKLPWFRLRYSVTPDDAADAATTSASRAEGIISLSQITPDLFNLYISGAAYAYDGMRYRARVHASHPVTMRPLAGVQVEAKAEFSDNDDDKRAPLVATGVTDAEGYVALDFDLPPDMRGEDFDVNVTARHGALEQTASDEVRIEHLAEILVNTDKPIYQPGQMLHARVLLFDQFNRRAIAEAAAEIEIEDSENTTVHRASLKTSRFGIASIDWPIPDDARLGEYDINVRTNSAPYDDGSTASHRVKISRYELPNFSVSAKPDNKYYLPGQNAEVEIRADYLFGQPVRRGHVRVVRESERHWNYLEQKWEVKEEEKYEGIADEAGRFVARIDLSKAHDELPTGNDEWRPPFSDLSYAAYFTDPTTNRTEQRRFDLRVTREAIHVYAISGYYDQAPNFPIQFYLSTFYADGTPAHCTVDIKQQLPSPAFASNANASRLNTASLLPRQLRAVKTNRFGLAAVENLQVVPADDGNDDISLVITARDAEGRTGQRVKEFDMDADRTVVRVRPAKTLHRAGEPLRAEIAVSTPAKSASVEVWHESRVVHAETVRLEAGKGSVEIPYKKEFKDELNVVAFVAPVAGSNQSRSGAHTVLYPRERELQLDVRLNQETYRPGEEASADFRVLSPDGREVESALGVTVFDRAIEERARTDREFGGRYHDYDGSYRARRGAAQELSGVTRRDIDHLNLSRKPPDDIDLLAEIMLNRDGSYIPLNNFSETFTHDQSSIFRNAFEAQLRPLRDALAEHYAKNMEYPKTDADLRQTLAASGIDLDALRDPWGQPYTNRFFVEQSEDVLEIVSASADKAVGTEDDTVALRVGRPYFQPVGVKINQALEQHHKRTGGFIRDAATLKSELSLLGVDSDALRDPWGSAYQFSFGIDGYHFNVAIKSGGVNRRFEAHTYDADDFVIWTASIDYFTDSRARIEAALDDYISAGKPFPQSNAEFRAVLRAAKIDESLLIDAWGHPYEISFSSNLWQGATATISTYARGQERAKEKIGIKNVKKQVHYVTLFSHGADGREATSDDFKVATFARFAGEHTDAPTRMLGSAGTHAPVKFPNTNRAAGTGAISGTVIDPNGAVVPGASVSLRRRSTAQTSTLDTNDEGFFLFDKLPDGLYEIQIESRGFMDAIITDVEVVGGKMTEIAAMLQIGRVTETVMVAGAAAEPMQTAQTALTSSNVLKLNLPGKRGTSLRQPDSARGVDDASISTPRLREYFPETLVWQPALETDASGQAHFSFRLADQITTWKMSVVASTADGEIGFIEKEFRAFQPFFVEHDPPRILTEGDEIQLPVVLRNYLNRPQTVDVEIKPENWFTLSGATRQTAEVAAGEATRATFDVRAVASVRDGKQRVTAIAADASDAIEKPVTVHPNGEELVATSGQIFGATGTLEADVPAAAIVGTPRAQLKIYPNLMSHVVEGVEGILQRPYGCGEQTISSTYPNLLVLRHYRRRGDNNQTLPHVAAKAQRYLEDGYKRLLNYRHASGGFSYWQDESEADAALTAYALQFLTDAVGVIPVDREVIRGARGWLVKQQHKNGSWQPRYFYRNTEDERHALMQTAYVARVLARARLALASLPSTGVAADEESRAAAASLKNALNYLAPHVAASTDPYFIASYALAAAYEGDVSNTRRALARLRATAHVEAGTAHWKVQLATPFHGWGRTGDIETTALAVQALTRPVADGAAAASGDDALVNRALLYIFRNKDRFGVWYSTQATINVLDTFTNISSNKDSSNTATRSDGTTDAAAGQYEIFVNNQRVNTINIPASNQPTNALSIDLSPFINTSGNHRVEIRHGSAANTRATSARATAQLVTTYYVPWSHSPASRDGNSPAVAGHGEAAATTKPLRLSVTFDKTEAAINQEITCSVAAERTSSPSGHGMLLGEIGLPPGAEVDRASLERAARDAGLALNHYDVLPDRIVVYLWPYARQGVRFNFKFRPRFGLVAQTAPSVLYDYYNPEARTVVAPTKFVIR